MPRPVMSKTFSSVMSTFSRHCEPSTRFLRIRPTVTLRAVRSRSRDTCSRRGDIHGTGGGAAEGVPVVPGNARTSQPRPGGRSVEVVDSRTEIRDFLTSRRAKITPDQVGLPVYGGNRRVAGLRREEVALLAGVSVDYYTRLERGNLNGVSESVTISAYSAEPGSPSLDAPNLLAGWAATPSSSPHTRPAARS